MSVHFEWLLHHTLDTPSICMCSNVYNDQKWKMWAIKLNVKSIHCNILLR